jgi:4-carboxymuconolactone decarboxylase
MATSRIPYPDPSSMDDMQKAVYDAIAGGPRGFVRGPLLLLLHSPEIADKVQTLGAELRTKGDLGPRAKEIAILLIASHLKSDYVIAAHRRFALNAELLSEHEIDTLVQIGKPITLSSDESIIFDFCRELLANSNVSDEVLDALKARMDAKSIVDLVTLVGYYHIGTLLTNVAQVEFDP